MRHHDTIFHDFRGSLLRKIRAVLTLDNLDHLGRIEKCLRAGGSGGAAEG